MATLPTAEALVEEREQRLAETRRRAHEVFSRPERVQMLEEALAAADASAEPARSENPEDSSPIEELKESTARLREEYHRRLAERRAG